MVSGLGFHDIGYAVGLEYTIAAATCVFSQQHGALSGGDPVLVYESAENLFSPDPVLR
jgi:hypothetical protein